MPKAGGDWTGPGYPCSYLDRSQLALLGTLCGATSKETIPWRHLWLRVPAAHLGGAGGCSLGAGRARRSGNRALFHAVESLGVQRRLAVSVAMDRRCREK